MPRLAAADDEEIAQSIRKITAERKLKRFVALATLVLGVLGFAAAIALSYRDVPEPEPLSPPVRMDTR